VDVRGEGVHVRTCAERTCFASSEIITWRAVVALVERVRFDDCRCHELARAVLAVIKDHSLVLEDGRVGPVEHSWLRFRQSWNVLDVYRPGVMPGVVLVDRIVSLDYRVGVIRDDIRDVDVQRLIKEMT
jgi:hypothetical protein